MDAAFEEESRILAQVEQRLDALASMHTSRAARLLADLSNTPPFDRGSLLRREQLLNERNASLALVQTIQDSLDEPYFARVDLELTGRESSSPLVCYIGRREIREDSDFIVYDWRSPAGELFFRTEEEQFSVDLEGDGYRTDCRVVLRRSLRIRNGILVSCSTEYAGDRPAEEKGDASPALTAALQARQEGVQTEDILPTLQDFQDRIIRLPRSRNFAVQGPAGSGKTAVMLHRLSWLKHGEQSGKLEGVRVITPNQPFADSLEDLCRRLDIDDIPRLSVEALYTSLIAQLSGGTEPRPDVLSEKTMNPQLLEELYSMDCQDSFIRRYQETWDSAAAALDLPRLRALAVRAGVTAVIPDTRTAETVSAVSLVIQSVRSRLADADTRIAAAKAEREKALQEAAKLKESLAEAEEKASEERDRVLRRLQKESARTDAQVQEEYQRCPELRTSADALQEKLAAAEAKMQQASEDYARLNVDLTPWADYDSFVRLDDSLTAVLREKLPERIAEIEAAEREAADVHAFNFVKRGSRRRELDALKNRFGQEAGSLLLGLRRDAQNRETAAEREIRNIRSALDSASAEAASGQRRLSAVLEQQRSLRTCLKVLQSDALPAPGQVAGLVSQTGFTSEFADLQKLLADLQGLNRKLKACTDAADRCGEEIRSLTGVTLSADEQTYLDRCSASLRNLQYGALSRSVLFTDLVARYKAFGQGYSTAGYRHKLYLQLLLCSLYYPPLKDPGRMLLIDEAQDISPAEYRLLRQITGSSCVFNLFGSTEQRSCSFKGTSSWQQIPFITGGNIHEISGSFRNTEQTAAFCTRFCGLETPSSGILGPAVQEMNSTNALLWILKVKRENPSLRTAVIFRHGLRAVQELLRKQFAGVDISWYRPDRSRISVLSAEASRGLEFDAAVVFTDRMTPMEQSIAITRTVSMLTVVKDVFPPDLAEDSRRMPRAGGPRRSGTAPEPS